MSKGILTVTVNPAVDVTVALPAAGPLRRRSEVPPTAEAGAATPDIFGQGAGTADLRMRCSTNLVLSAGGKGINVARALRALRVRALAVGVAGGSAGELLQKLLREERIPAEFVEVPESTRFNVTVLGPRPGHCRRILGEGPRLTSKEIRRFESHYRRWLRRSYFVVLSGRNAVGTPVDWYARLVRLARREGVPAAVDTSGAALAAALQAKPFLIKPNLAEAEEILQCRINSSLKIKNSVRRFHGRGISVVLLSLGARGAVASAGQEIWCARPPRVRAVNEVGCGDALLAGFIQAHGGGKSLPEALRQAVACGTANVFNSTPGLIHPHDVLRLIKKVTVSNRGTRGR